MSKRRARGEGSVRQLANGRWQGKTSYIDAAGRRHQPSVVLDTRKAVVAWLHQQHDAQNRGQQADVGKRTVETWLDEWLTLKKPHLEARSHDACEQHVRLHLKPIVGRIHLGKLRPFHIASLYSALADKGVSPAMQRHVGVTLTTALHDAVRQGYLSNNPARVIKKPKSKRPEIHPLDSNQVRSFLAATATDRLHALYVLALDTGMRQGELFGLHWPEIDFTSGLVTVKQSLEERQGHHRLKEPKTSSSRRRIVATPATMAALNTHRQQQLAAGHYQTDGLVFTNSKGGFLNKGNFRNRSFAAALRRAGLSPIRFHDLRHTAATLMLLNGINVKAVAATLGHKDAFMTLNVYAHVLPQMNEERVAVMQSILAIG
jgi:integrase